MAWNPRTDEDQLLQSYRISWGNHRDVLFAEVPVGKCRGRKPRRIDGVHFLLSKGETQRFGRSNRARFRRLVKEASRRGTGIEVVEVKATLNRSVIGQAIVAKHLLDMEYGTNASAVVVCKRRNSKLQAVCKILHVKVWTPRRGFVVS